MAAKAILVLCAQTLLIQSALSQYFSPVGAEIFVIGSPLSRRGHGLAFNGYDNLGFGHNWACNGLLPDARPSLVLPCSTMEITPTTGGFLPVTSSSDIPPVGISIVSENSYEGLLTVAGEVPFVGTTGMGGTLLTGGTGAIDYGCGDEATAMVSKVAPAAFAAGIGTAAIAPALAAPAIASAAIAPGFASNACDLSGRDIFFE